VVWNNFAHGPNVGQSEWQKRLSPWNRFASSDASLTQEYFIKAAQADGFRYAVRLDRKEECRGLSDKLSTSRARLLEVIIDRDAGVYPMVGPARDTRGDDHG